MPRLTILIVSYNSRGDLDRCLDALRAGAPAIAHEVVVVDNASPDDTAAFLRNTRPGVRVIDAGGNVGFARANNIGIRATAGEYVLLLNPDTEVTPGAIDALVQRLETRAGTVAVGPRLIDGNGRAELSFGRMITPLNEARQKLLVVGNDRGWRWVVDTVARMTSRSRRVDWVSGACLLARRADLEAVGLFDERYFLYTEDVDLCASLRTRGDIWFDAGVTVVHHRGLSAATAPGATRQAYRRSQLAFYDKHHPRWARALRAYLRLKGEG